LKLVAVIYLVVAVDKVKYKSLDALISSFSVDTAVIFTFTKLYILLSESYIASSGREAVLKTN